MIHLYKTLVENWNTKDISNFHLRITHYEFFIIIYIYFPLAAFQLLLPLKCQETKIIIIMSSSANPTPATEPIDDEDSIEKVKSRATDLINTAAYTKAELLDQVTYLFVH